MTLDEVLEDEILDTKEAAKYAKLSQSHVQLLLRTKKVKGWRKGKAWLTTKSEIDKYLESDPKPGPKPGSKHKH